MKESDQVARASNPENNPNAKTPPTPSTGHTSAADRGSIPAITVHGRKPNFPNQPGPPTEKTSIPGTKMGVDHDWFHV